MRMIKTRRVIWTGHAARMGERRNAYRILVGKAEGKKTLGRPRRRWEDNIKMTYREIGWGAMDSIDLAQDKDQWRALVNTVINLQVPYNVGKFLSSYATGGFSRWAQLHGVSSFCVFQKIQFNALNILRSLVLHRTKEATQRITGVLDFFHRPVF
jgi:hypothetical protein